MSGGDHRRQDYRIHGGGFLDAARWAVVTYWIGEHSFRGDQFAGLRLARRASTSFTGSRDFPKVTAGLAQADDTTTSTLVCASSEGAHELLVQVED